MTEPPTTIAQIAAQLEEMLVAYQQNPTLTRRLLGQRLRVLYEFLPHEHGAQHQEIVTYLLAIEPDRASVERRSAPYDEVDVVVRTTPDTLRRVTSGELGGREAMVSGLLDLRKTPSMPKLLLMRALFTAYKKARLRATEPARRGEVTG